jgi:hypothetical protein
MIKNKRDKNTYVIISAIGARNIIHIVIEAVILWALDI